MFNKFNFFQLQYILHFRNLLLQESVQNAFPQELVQKSLKLYCRLLVQKTNTDFLCLEPTKKTYYAQKQIQLHGTFVLPRCAEKQILKVQKKSVHCVQKKQKFLHRKKKVWTQWRTT